MARMKLQFQKQPRVDFDLRSLEIFQKVVELGSFSKAAKAVYLAQASVSERIATLENNVGTKLLDRLGRTVVPTRAGNLLYRHSLALLSMKKNACLELEDFLGLKRGEIHIGGSTIPGEYILPKVIGRFRDKYPDIAITLDIAPSAQIEARVFEGELELGIIGSKSTNKAAANNELWKDELVVAVASDHAWSKRKSVSIEELKGQALIIRQAGSGTLKILQEHIRGLLQEGLEDFQIVARLGSSTAVKEAVKAGLGVSVISSRALETELEAGTLKALRIKKLPLIRKFYLVRDKRRHASPLCRVMVEFLLETSHER